MWEKIRVIFTIPELRQKVLLTLMFLAIYRIGWQIPLPIVDQNKMTAFFSQQGEGGLGQLIEQVAVFSASQLSQATIFGLGIMPYISASIIFQLLGSVYPPLERLQKEGESGRKKINEYTRYATVVLCLGQSWFYVRFLAGSDLVREGILGANGTLGIGWQFTAVLTMTAGTVFLMWLGEQIDEYGIGNGISLLIMAGILARMPAAGMKLIQPMIDQGGRQRGGRRGLHHPGPTPHPHAKRQTRPRAPGLRWNAAIPSFAGKPGRRDADHLCQQPAAVSVGAVQVAVEILANLFAPPKPQRCLRARRVVRLQRLLRGHDLLLLLLLDSHHVQSQGYVR
jgi:hypothetical protein